MATPPRSPVALRARRSTIRRTSPGSAMSGRIAHGRLRLDPYLHRGRAGFHPPGRTTDHLQQRRCRHAELCGHSTFGLISRIAHRPVTPWPVYGVVRDGVFIDAVPVPYDTACLPHALSRALAGRHRPRINPIFGASSRDPTIRSRWRSPRDRASVSRHSLPVSVIIPVLDEAEGIVAALQALAHYRRAAPR